MINFKGEKLKIKDKLYINKESPRNTKQLYKAENLLKIHTG